MSQPHTAPRYANQVSFSFLLWMVLFAVLFATGGVTYSVLKNNQVAVRTEIKKLRRAVAVHNMNANQYRAQANALTNRWAMRDRLTQDCSTLRDIERSQIETVSVFSQGDIRQATAAR